MIIIMTRGAGSDVLMVRLHEKQYKRFTLRFLVYLFLTRRFGTQYN